MNSIDFYNKMSAKFLLNLTNGRMLPLRFGVYKKIFNDIDNKLNFKQTDFVLDLGGGTGLIAKRIISKCAAVELADGAESALAVARKKLNGFNNVSYRLTNIEKVLPYKDNSFDKVVCYGVVQCLSDYKYFVSLLKELIRIVRPNGGMILIGDIPLDEKYKLNLDTRKKYPVKNFILNQNYYFKKYITNLFYKFAKIEPHDKSKVFFTKGLITETLGKFDNIEYYFLEQNKKLPFSNSREDLIIKK